MAKAYSATVNPAGGSDYTSINAAIAALAAGDSIYCKSGVYTAAEDISKAVFVFVEAGSSFTHASGLTVSAVKAGLLLGNGCAITNALTISGTDSWVKARNGLDTGGMVISGARSFFDGGGWGTLHDGGTLVRGINLTGDDVIVQNCRVQTSGGGFAAVETSTGARTTVRLVQVPTSGNAPFTVATADSLIEGCEALGGTYGLYFNALRCRCIGSHVAASTGTGLQFTALADDSVAVGNVIEATTGDEIDLDLACENCVVVANRVFGTIDDNSGTSTVQFCDLGTATCTVTGTAADGVTEAQVVNGGETLILTLANAVWINPVPAGSVWRALFDSAQAEAAGWDALESTILADAAFVRTSDTVVTITFQAAGTYSITADETINFPTLDATVLASEDTIAPSVTSFVVTNA